MSLWSITQVFWVQMGASVLLSLGGLYAMIKTRR